MKHVRLAWQIFACMIVLLMLLPLMGCATARYLTAEQDAEFRSVCERQGCSVIPTPVWRQIEQLLKTLGVMADV